MPEIENVGKIIASRELIFVSSDGSKEEAFLRVGMPYEYTKSLDWCCPYELGTASEKKIFGMIGIDALQALELTMKTLSVEIEHWERKKKGKFHFLDKKGAGL